MRYTRNSGLTPKILFLYPKKYNKITWMASVTGYYPGFANTGSIRGVFFYPIIHGDTGGEKP